jgi:GNAT superfamily N-acetyltransferase
VEVRPATPGDAEAIERIRVRGWQIAYRHVFPPEELDRLTVEWSRWAESLAHPQPGFTCLVAVEEGRVVGWTSTGPSGDSGDAVGELHGLYVDPDCWGRGAGRALLERAEAELARRWRHAVLWTLEDNPRTRGFYEAAGWRLDGLTGIFERLGAKATLVRYVKRVRRSTSRS